MLQVEVRDAHGQWVATTDVAWPALRAVGEVDGRVKYDQLLTPGTSATDALMAEKRRKELIKGAGAGLGGPALDSGKPTHHRPPAVSTFTCDTSQVNAAMTGEARPEDW